LQGSLFDFQSSPNAHGEQWKRERWRNDASPDDSTLPTESSEDPRLAEVRRIAAKYRISEDRAIAAWQLAQQQAAATGIDPVLLMAIWHKESTSIRMLKIFMIRVMASERFRAFWVDGRIGIVATPADLMRADFNAEATAHVLLYFMGQTQLADARPGPTVGQKLFSLPVFFISRRSRCVQRR